MIAAGVNAKALSTYMGHSRITVTLDRYGHLMPGNEREAATLLADYLQKAWHEAGPLAFGQQARDTGIACRWVHGATVSPETGALQIARVRDVDFVTAPVVVSAFPY